MSEFLHGARKAATRAAQPRNILNAGVGKNVAPDSENVLFTLLNPRGAGEEEVELAAGRHLSRLNRALEAYNNEKSALLKRGVSEVEAERLATKALDRVSETVARAAKEAGPDGTGAVVADVAKALAAVGQADPAALSMILRRAGNPELFQPLAANLGDTPTVSHISQQVGAADAALDDHRDRPPTQKDGPVAHRKASVMGLPSKVTRGGKIEPASKRYKSVGPKDNDPNKSDLARVIKDEATGEWRMYDPKTDAARFDESKPARGAVDESTRASLLRKMAGDQMRQVEAIEEKGMTARPPRAVESEDAPEVDASTLTTGTEVRKGGTWSKKRKALTDNEVANRNRGYYQKLHDAIEYAYLNNGVVDFDKVAPWIRARFPDFDGGKIFYPKKFVSGQWLAGFMQTSLGYGRDFAKVYGDVIQRSLDALPEAPSTPKAAEWATKAFIPNKSFRPLLEAGPGSPDYPHPIYGPRQADLPDVTEPQEPNLQKPPVRKSTQDALDRLKKMEGARKPGTNDQSSIYSMPGRKALAGLLA